MHRIFQAVRAALLAVALVLLGWGAFSTPTDAEATLCSGSGTDCIIVDNGVVKKYKKIIHY